MAPLLTPTPPPTLLFVPLPTMLLAPLLLPLPQPRPEVFAAVALFVTKLDPPTTDNWEAPGAGPGPRFGAIGLYPP